MFPEYRELMTKLKAENDLHFTKLFDEHNQLDEEITNIENDPVQAVSRESEIESLKRKKLALKDELGRYLATKA
ncbi:YdcH family protein [Moraxella nasovis]|uniref:YdcH family protein n=1 Tax=Moraxella nasovis TaxID=2904121 RepID=UPI001F60F14B|nr:YdcH family protein [Moraxella nasovis]UNU73940.1 YdcH family protein [Moraxella nasovis]